MVKTTYNTAYIPPIPALTVSFGLPGETAMAGPYPALVDTGADTTLLPIAHLRHIQAPIWDTAYLRSQWGERRVIYTYLLDLHIEAHNLPGIVVVGDDQGQEIILGRNVLNRLILLLNGPQTTIHLLSQLPRNLG